MELQTVKRLAAWGAHTAYVAAIVDSKVLTTKAQTFFRHRGYVGSGHSIADFKPNPNRTRLCGRCVFVLVP